jgi:major intracellular serine protease
MKRKNNYSLLPYEVEPVYGLSPEDSQFYGWEIETFKIKNHWKFSKGDGIVVAVIDTGCDLDHDDLKHNLVQGVNFVEPSRDPIDKCGHGTHVAGTIAASDNGLGMVGVAPKAKIMPIKALNDSGMGSNEDIIKGIYWAIDNKADFITMSLGSPVPSPRLEKAIDFAKSKNIVVFCAAGNSGESSEILYPAKYDYPISIGAIDSNFERTSFTCSGDELDFLAPGHDILSCYPGNTYAKMSGTSMSNPFAVGCAALAKSYYGNQLTTKEDYIELFKKTAIQLKNTRHKGIRKYEGYGIIQPTP